MAVFDELTQRVKDVVSVASDRTRDAAEQVRLNMAIAGEQREIDKNCLAIGQWFSSEYDGEIPEGIQDLVNAVHQGKARIAELEASKIRSKAADDSGIRAEPLGKTCPICGEVSDSRFCPQCGAPMGE